MFIKAQILSKKNHRIKGGVTMSSSQLTLTWNMNNHMSFRNPRKEQKIMLILYTPAVSGINTYGIRVRNFGFWGGKTSTILYSFINLRV